MRNYFRWIITRFLKSCQYDDALLFHGVGKRGGDIGANGKKLVCAGMADLKNK